ncbi:hypothetical protein AAG570_014014 [Ranatra chinensis]|uniref:Uncharacterized protein n=1 Tax=Ranatra chinensis TaxID=642074 RepID=A0ABD0Y7I9_9HEMI
MKISTKGRYSLRILLDMAEHKDDGFISLKTIADRQNLSKKYLDQIMLLLNRTGYLKTARGAHGGYKLAKDPSQYTLGGILRLTEGGIAPLVCLEDGSEECSSYDNCMSRKVWQGLGEVMSEYLDNLTLQDILDKYGGNVLCSALGLDCELARGMERPLLREPEISEFFHGPGGMAGITKLPEITKQVSSIHAVEALRKVIETSRDKVCLATMGPLTNIAVLFRIYPHVKDNIECVSMMGGGITHGNVSQYAEFNINFDPESAEIVFSSGIPIIMSGLDLTEQVQLKQEQFERFKDVSDSGRMFYDMMSYHVDIAKSFGFEGGNMHDPCTIAWLLKPELFVGERGRINVVLEGEQTGRTMFIPDESGNVLVLTGGDTKAISDFIERVLKDLKIKAISLLTAAVLALFVLPANIFANQTIPDESYLADTSENEKSSLDVQEENVLEEQAKSDLHNIPDTKSILDFSEADGELAAELLEQVEDIEEYQRILRLLLNLYYTKNDVSNLEAFSLNLGSRASEILSNYSAAAIEREKETSLGYVPGEVLVVFKQEVPRENAETVLEKTFDTEIETLDPKNLEGEPSIALVEIPLENTVEQAIEELSANESIAVAEPNYLLEIADQDGNLTAEALLPNDPKATDEFQWHLSQINVPEAWEMLEPLTDRRKIKIAVIDTSMDIDHEDFIENINKEDSVDVTGGETLPMSSPQAHGTHVAGIIGATTNNSIGIAGVGTGYNNSISEIILVGASHDIKTLKTSDVISGINWAIEKKADIINLSLGGKDYIFSLEAAVNRADAAGILVVAAAGNNSSIEKYYPSDYEASLSVISVTKELTRSPFSNYGEQKDISAPGSSIGSTVVGGYSSMSGTSMAAPVVAGTAAMVMYANPELSRHDVKKILKETATDLYTPGFDIYSAWGCVNAKEAVAAALEWEPAEQVAATGISLDKSDLEIDFGTYENRWTPVRLNLNGKLAPGTGYSAAYRYDNGNTNYSKLITLNANQQDAFPKMMEHIDSGCEPGGSYLYKFYAYAFINGKSVLCKTPAAIEISTVLPAPDGLTAPDG